MRLVPTFPAANRWRDQSLVIGTAREEGLRHTESGTAVAAVVTPGAQSPCVPAGGGRGLLVGPDLSRPK